MLKVLNCNYLQGDFINRPGYAFDSFKKDLTVHRQGIIAYWNGPMQNTFLPSVGMGAHFIYVRKDVSNNSDGSSNGEYVIYNRGVFDKATRAFLATTAPVGKEMSIIGAGDFPEANRKTIGYYVVE